MTTLLIILISIYIVSFIGAYKYIQLAHSKNGNWSCLNPDIGDYFVTFCPVCNTIVASKLIFNPPVPSTSKTPKFNFFRIKK